MKTCGFQTFPFLIGVPVAETTGNCKLNVKMPGTNITKKGEM
jgi:hypothetical protein